MSVKGITNVGANESKEEWNVEDQAYNESLQQYYSIPFNTDITILIGEYFMTYAQARRFTMFNDGLSFNKIAELENVSKSTIQVSIQQARNKLSK